MRNALKRAALGVGMALGAVTVAHAAQQPVERQIPLRTHSMGQAGMMGQVGDGPMMNDPQMRRDMSQMMQGCQRMMARMENIQEAERPRR